MNKERKNSHTATTCQETTAPTENEHSPFPAASPNEFFIPLMDSTKTSDSKEKEVYANVDQSIPHASENFVQSYELNSKHISNAGISFIFNYFAIIPLSK